VWSTVIASEKVTERFVIPTSVALHVPPTPTAEATPTVTQFVPTPFASTQPRSLIVPQAPNSATQEPDNVSLAPSTPIVPTPLSLFAPVALALPVQLTLIAERTPTVTLFVVQESVPTLTATSLTAEPKFVLLPTEFALNVPSTLIVQMSAVLIAWLPLLSQELESVWSATFHLLAEVELPPPVTLNAARIPTVTPRARLTQDWESLFAELEDSAALAQLLNVSQTEPNASNVWQAEIVPTEKDAIQEISRALWNVPPALIVTKQLLAEPCASLEFAKNLSQLFVLLLLLFAQQPENVFNVLPQLIVLEEHLAQTTSAVFVILPPIAEATPAVLEPLASIALALTTTPKHVPEPPLAVHLPEFALNVLPILTALPVFA